MNNLICLTKQKYINSTLRFRKRERKKQLSYKMISKKKLCLPLTCLLVIACSSLTVKSDAVYKMKLSRDAVKKTDYSAEELNLMKQLFKSYNQYQKPYGIVQLQFALELLSVVNVRAKEQTVELNTKLYQTWIDGRLTWSDVYSNLQTLFILLINIFI